MKYAIIIPDGAADEPLAELRNSVRHRGASTHAGTGTSNTDYYCFGEPIRAPGDGTVAAAGDGIADNRPGSMNAVP